MSEEGKEPEDEGNEGENDPSTPSEMSGSRARDLESDAARLEQARAFAEQTGLGEPFINESGKVEYRLDPRSKYNEQVAEQILNFIRMGSWRKVACMAAGITPRTLQRWEKEARAGREPFVGFWERMAIAEAQAEVNTLGVIVAASRGKLPPKEKKNNGEYDPEDDEDGGDRKGKRKKPPRHKDVDPTATGKYDWHAAAFILERRGPRRWAQRQSVDLRGGAGGKGVNLDGPKVSIALPPERDE